MVVAGGVGDSYSNHDLIEERRLRQLEAGASEVVPRVKCELIDSCFDSIAGEQRRVGTAVRVGRARCDAVSGAVSDDVKLHAHTGGGHAPRGIEHVRGQACHISAST